MVISVTGSKSRIYELDTDKVTCTCSDFIYKRKGIPSDDPGRLCKHLKSELESHPEYFPSILVKNYNAVNDVEHEVGFLKSDFQSIVGVIKNLFNPILEEGEVFDVTGDYRRGAPRIDYLEVLVGLRTLRELQFNKMFLDLLRVDVLKVTDTIFEFVFKSDGYKKVRVTIVPINEFPYQQLFMTGDKDEVLRVVNAYYDHGMRLTKNGINGKDVPEIKSESDIYSYINLNYPFERTIFDTIIEGKIDEVIEDNPF